jgi:dephospho-CoA kinase
MSRIIGLTGGIGSGKSTIAKVFVTLGIPVFDADSAAKQIMNDNTEIKEKLLANFGTAVYKNNILDREYLAKIVFSDAFKLELLNSIVHPITIQAAKEWASLQKAPYVIKEAALFFESASSQGVEKIIGVSAPLSLRIHRVMKRDNCTKEEVAKRMSHQISETLKMKLCDYVIINDEQQLVVPQVTALHEQLLSLS